MNGEKKSRYYGIGAMTEVQQEERGLNILRSNSFGFVSVDFFGSLLGVSELLRPWSDYAEVQTDLSVCRLQWIKFPVCVSCLTSVINYSHRKCQEILKSILGTCGHTSPPRG